MGETRSSSEAFQPLGNEQRTAVIEALYDDGPETRSFSALAEATEADTTAGFAYHLRQLTGHYLRETEHGYTLTDAGVRVARAIESGAFTESIDRSPTAIDDPCPFCGTHTLEARTHDNTVTVQCSSCDASLLRLSFPPGGHRTHTDDTIPTAVNRLYRHRINTLCDGFCPTCGATAQATMNHRSVGERERAQVNCSCTRCGYQIDCPVTATVLNHPAVVSFYYERGESLENRPLWNVGTEWGERVLSDDPWCVQVTTSIDDDELALLVGEDTTVVSVTETSGS